ncbi:MAG: SRPBCC family protein [Myxococcales bacterium]|nr:SRPBCC family protein [Myxococcales bacterium]
MSTTASQPALGGQTRDLPTDPPTVDVTGRVRAPIDQVWALFRPFAELDWWPIYQWVRLEGSDEVGAVRTFLTKTGRTYAEKLVERDDATFTERYDLVSLSPSVPSLNHISTVVSMKAEGADTVVHWRSWVQAGSLVLGQIRKVQTEVYTNAIRSLDSHFHPALGTLDVIVAEAAGLPREHTLWPLDPYVSVRLDEGEPQRTRVRFATTHPTFHHTLSFEVLSNQGTLEIGAWDAHLGRDHLLGTATIDLHTLKAGVTVPQTLELSQGGTVDVELRLTLTDGESLPPTDAMLREAHWTSVQRVIAKLQEHVMAIAAQAAEGPQERWAYDRYPRSPQLPDVPLEELPRMVRGLPPSQALSPHKLGRMVERMTEYVYSQVAFMKRAEEAADPFTAYFGGWIEAPERLIERWTDDEELARQFIQGVNPTTLTRVTDLSQLPVGFRTLTPGGRPLAELLAEHRLFLQDYAALAGARPYEGMLVYAPWVLVTRTGGEDGQRLTISAIQLERSDRASVYTPDRTPPRRWTFAKMHVACADNQVHQWLAHLGFAHLAMEPFAIAWHNALPSGHVLHDLLAPHFHDTIGINFLARQTLVSDIAPFTDRTFSTGTAQALEIFLHAWKGYDFFSRGFAAQLEARGFDEMGTDGVDDYLYRDDGYRIWNALGRYVQGVVERTWASDEAVASDEVIRAWCQELTDPDRGDVPGFPATIHSRQLLVQTLQTLIWCVSAAHSAVNFSQFDYLSYVPNRPDSLFAPMPPGQDEIDEDVLRNALPSPVISHFQISFAWLLTAPSEHTLLDVTAMAGRYPEVHAAFLSEMQQISGDIQARNEALQRDGKAPYPYLDPAQVAASIAI